MGQALRQTPPALVEALGQFIYDPVGFVMAAFPWGQPGTELERMSGPDDWQLELLADVGERLTADPSTRIRSAVRSGHGVGKSTVTAWIILWAMSTRPHLSGVVTANTGTQLATKTWRELALWHKRLINRDWFRWTATKFHHVDHPESWFTAAIPNTEHNSEAFAGLHSRYVLVIFDEASAIPDRIWEVTLGAMTTPGALWFVFGNPTRNTGAFRQCFGAQGHRWIQRRIDARDAKMADRAYLQELVEDYGIDNDLVRVRVLGEFPRASDTQFIPVHHVEAAQARSLEVREFAQYPKVIGVDVARFGTDSSVIVVRQGPKVFEPRVLEQIDTMQLAAHVADLARREQPTAIHVDETGLGAGVVDRLREVGLPVFGVNFGASPNDPRTFANKRSELWGALRDWLATPVQLPPGARLREELIGPEYGYDASMRIVLERKDSMRRRGLASPDIADAIACTFNTFTAHHRPTRGALRVLPKAFGSC